MSVPWLALACDSAGDRSDPAPHAPRPGDHDPFGAAKPTGKLSLPSVEPSSAMRVALGDFHSCSVVDGLVRCRGSNVYQQLGVEDAPGGRQSVQVPGLTEAVSVACGAKHACALRRDSTVWCWGLDQFGQTGHDGRQPAAVAGLKQVVGLALGDEHSCALLRTGVVMCWGRNEEGQLGSRAPRRRPARSSNPGAPLVPMLVPRNDEPRLVEVVADVVQVVAGARHSCARTISGSVWCWGANDVGQLGLGATSEPVRQPRAVPAVMSAVFVAAGGDQSCAALVDGSVRCWGRYAGSFVEQPEPAPWPAAITGLESVVAVDVGPSLGCAIAEDGALLCWKEGPAGAKGWYELGHPPKPVAGASGASWVVVGLTTACAARPGGEVVCWGRNPYGMVQANATKRLLEPAPYGDAALAKQLDAGTADPAERADAGVP